MVSPLARGLVFLVIKPYKTSIDQFLQTNFIINIAYKNRTLIAWLNINIISCKIGLHVSIHKTIFVQIIKAMIQTYCSILNYSCRIQTASGQWFEVGKDVLITVRLTKCLCCPRRSSREHCWIVVCNIYVRIEDCI